MRSPSTTGRWTSPSGARPTTRPGPLPRVTVEHNTLIHRPDLGPDCYTRVAAGHEIPLGLEDLPRHPVNPADAEQARTGRVMVRAYPGPGDFYGNEYPGMEDVLLNWTVPPPHPLIRVDVDTLIDRPDLGPGHSTRVNAGDHIPIQLEAYPRPPA